MKKIKIIILVLVPILIGMMNQFANAQSPCIHWQKCVGGTKDEYIQNIMKLADGNYLSCGTTNSHNGDFHVTHGKSDAFLMKTNGAGNIIWEKTYGGSSNDAFYGMLETSSGDLYAIGSTGSDNGQVSGHHGAVGSDDIWLVRTNSQGTLLSQHCYGGSGDEYSLQMIMTAQNNIVFAAFTTSNDGDVSNNHGDFDGWVVKLKPSGAVMFSVTIGDTAYDDFTGIAEINGNFIVTGITSPQIGDLAEPVYDAHVAKLDQSGNIIYYRKYGGSGSDNCNAMVATSDGNAVLTGHVASSDGDVPSNYGNNMWALKIDVANGGNIIWQSYIGLSNDTAAGFNIFKTHDGGFVIIGGIGPSTIDASVWDGYAAKVDASGNLLWTKQIGGDDLEILQSGVEENDGSLLLAGNTLSNNGDVSGNHGRQDCWMVNLDACGNRLGDEENNSVSLRSYPNPFSLSTTISFSLSQSQKVSLKIFDVSGRLISTIANKVFDEGENEIIWNANDVNAGIYFLQFQSAELSKIVKLIATE